MSAARHAGKRGRLHGQFGMLAVTVPIAAAVFTVSVALLAAAATARRAAAYWRSLGPHGRLAAGMVASWPAAVIAADAGVLPDGSGVTLVAGLAGTGLFGMSLAVLRWCGQRQWRERGGTVLQGGVEAAVQASAGQIAADRARLAELELRLNEQAGLTSAILAMVRDACDAAGLPAVSASDHTQPQLRLVGRD